MSQARKIYVGCWRHVPPELLTGPPISLHPLQFQEFYDSLESDCFTNNVYFVSCAAHENVFVIKSDGQIVGLANLAESCGVSRDFQQEFGSGELWSFLNGADQL